MKKLEKFINTWCQIIGGVTSVILVAAIGSFIILFFMNVWIASEKIIGLEIPKYNQNKISITIAGCDIKQPNDHEWKITNSKEIYIKFDKNRNVDDILITGEGGVIK